METVKLRKMKAPGRPMEIFRFLPGVRLGDQRAEAR